MVKFASKVFGVTIFALVLIWFASPGDATQNVDSNSRTLWDYTYAQAGDSIHINVDGEQAQDDSGIKQRDNFLRSVKVLNQTAFKMSIWTRLSLPVFAACSPISTVSPC